MRCMLKVHTDNKEQVLWTTWRSVECKVKNGYTYLWYHTKKEAKIEMDMILRNLMVQVNVLDGWENDGFVTFLR